METIDKILQTISGAFSRFCSNIKRHGVFIALLAFIMLMVMWQLVVSPLNTQKIVDKVLERQQQEQANTTQRSMEMRIQADEVIEPILEEIVAKYPTIDRAMIYEKHNSIVNISGIDFLYFSSTLEVLDINKIELEYIGEDFQRQYVSNMFGNLIKVLKYKDSIYFDNISDNAHPQHRILQKLNKHGVNSVLFVGVKNSKGRPLIILAFTSSEDEFDYDAVLDDLRPHLPIIKEMLIQE